MRFFHGLMLGLSLLTGSATAQTYPDPSRPLKLVLAQAPGSASDVIARALAKAITDVSGANVIVEYKPGAETVVGMQYAMNSPPDGYTMLLTSSSSMVLNPLMVPNLPYDPIRDFIPVAAVVKSTLAFNLGPSTPFKSVREFIAAAKQNPGKYSFASSSTTTRLGGELLQSLAGIKLLSVNYKSTAAGLTAVASGEVDLMMASPSSVKPLWDSGRVRGVAMTGASRSPALPQLPTVAEEGVRGFDVTGWFATYFPAKTPRDRVVAMREIVRKAANAPAFEKAMTDAALDPMDLVGDDINALTRKELDMWGKVVRASGTLGK